MTTTPPPPATESLIQYPCAFPIKIMGERSDALQQAVVALAQQFDPDFDPATIELRDSASGKYQGITITITATSRAQLDDLYRALTSHPLVKVVL